MSKKIGFVTLGIFGVVHILGASIFLGFFKGIIDKKIREELPLKNGSDSYKRWQKVEVPIYIKFHIFHLENSKDYHNLSDIKLVERGPYVFEEEREKMFINYFENDKNESLVSYKEHRIYRFRKDKSNGLSLDDKVTVINLPVLGIVFHKWSLFLKEVIENYFKSDKSDKYKSLFIEVTVGDLLFKGLNFKLLTDVEEITRKINFPCSQLNPFRISIDGDDLIERSWAIHTGIDNIDKFGHIFEFDGQKTLRNTGPTSDERIWKKDVNDIHCNKLKGTDGTMFPPSLSQCQKLYVFEPQLCRSVYFKYGEETNVKGINVYRYWVPEEYFEGPLKNKDNECYCLEDDIKGECNWNGVLDISDCERMSKGAPVIMSAPYFHHGDQHIRDSINLKPNKTLNDENYGTFLDVEPITGTVLRAMRRLQVNIKVKKSKYFPQLQNLKDSDKFAVPIVWIEETAEADDKQANQFKDMVTNKVKLGIGISFAIAFTGTLILITAIVLIVRHKSNSEKSQNNNNNYW